MRKAWSLGAVPRIRWDLALRYAVLAGLLGGIVFFAVGIVRLTTDVRAATFRATLQATGDIRFTTGAESHNDTYLVRDLQAKNADVSIQNSDFDVYAVVTNNGLSYSHSFDFVLREVGVQIGDGGEGEPATVAMPGTLTKPASPLLRPVLLGGEHLTIWSMGDDTDANLTFDTTPTRLNRIGWQVPPGSTYRVEISPFPSPGVQFDRFEVNAPPGSSLELEVKNQLPWLFVFTGGLGSLRRRITA